MEKQNNFSLYYLVREKIQTAQQKQIQHATIVNSKFTKKMVSIIGFTTVKKINISEISIMHYINNLDVPAKHYLFQSI